MQMSQLGIIINTDLARSVTNQLWPFHQIESLRSYYQQSETKKVEADDTKKY